MPVIDVKFSRVRGLLNKDINISELEEVLFRFGMELDGVKETENGDYMLKIEVTPDRPDMLSTWGLARALRKYLGISMGLDEYIIKDSTFEIHVDESVTPIRPFIAAVVAKNVNLRIEDLEDLIYAQEKLHETFCRGRKKASIGFYPFNILRWPLIYRAEDPEKIRFRPLGFSELMNGREILQKHPTGQKYAHLLEGFDKYPIFTDSAGHVLSMPPIINSEDYGKITETDRDILLEVTGTHKPTVKLVVNIMASILKDLSADLYYVTIRYPKGAEKSPYLSPRKWKLSVKYVERILGIKISKSEIISLLNRMGLDGNFTNEEEIEVLVPGYRADIWHPIDIVDDIARAYGFDNFEPELTPVFTTGGVLRRTEIVDYIRELMLGLGYTEVFTFALTSTEDQFTKMLLPIDNEIVTIMGAKEAKINMMRKWLIPEILKTLAYNKDKKYPIKLFEVSDVVLLSETADTRAMNETRLAAVSAHKEADFTEIRRVTEYVLRALGFEKFLIKRIDHPSFIRGRVAGIYIDNELVCILGEMHPQVITNWGLTVPIAAMELSIDKLMKWSYKPVEIE